MSQEKRKSADVEMEDRAGIYLGWPGSNFGDGSEQLFSIYSKTMEKEDNKIANRWQGDAQGILIFTGFFSIVVAILVTMSIQDLRPRSPDDSAFYLQNIYQLLANSNIYDALTPPPPVITPPPFSPPRYAVWVNSLWFLSLAISLSSALFATMLQQWTHRYVTITQPVQCSPHKRARLRAFFSDGIDKLHLPWVIEALPILLHLSLSLFLAGLLIFLFNVNQTAFSAVVGWVGLFAGVYACITFMPIFRYDSPFYAPLSSTVWFFYAVTLYAVFRTLSFLPGIRDSFHDLKDRYREWVLGGVEKAAEDTALDQLSKVDCRILEWTIDTLREDDVTERFLGSIPGFCDSQAVQTRLPSLLQMKIRHVMNGFLDRTFFFESLSDSTKVGRLTICLDAAHAALGPIVVSRILSNIFDGRWRMAPRSIGMAYALRRWCKSRDDWIALNSRSIVARIIAVQRRRDNRWIELAEDQFNLPDRVLRDNIPFGDSVLLVILLHATLNIFHSVVPPWDSNILRVLSQFDIHNTLPQLQHDFCVLWNEIVREAQSRRPSSVPISILKEIHHLYIALHEGTHSTPAAFSASIAHGDDIVWDPMSYPLCDIASHNSIPLPQIYVSAVPYVDPTLDHMSPFTGHNLPRSLAPNRGSADQLQADLSFNDVPDEALRSVSVPTSPRSVSFENQPEQPLSTTSLNIVAADTAQGDPDISTSSLTHPTPQPISPGGSASQRSGGLTIASSPVVSDSTLPHIPMSTVSQTSPLDLPLNSESPYPQSEDIPRTPGSPSLSSPSVHPQLASDLDTQINGSHGVVGTTIAQDDAHDVDSPAPMEALCHTCPSIVACPDTSESTSRPEDHRRDSNQS